MPKLREQITAVELKLNQAMTAREPREPMPAHER
jgi:hypothetical protein